MSGEPLHCTKCDDIISTRQIAVVNARQIRLGKPMTKPKVCATCILNGIMTARPEEDAMNTARNAIVDAAKARRIAHLGQKAAVTWDEREQFWKELGRADYEGSLAVDALLALEAAAEQASKAAG